MSRSCAPPRRDRGTSPGVTGPATPDEHRRRACGSARPGRAQDHRVPVPRDRGQSGSGGGVGLQAECRRDRRTARGHARPPLAATRSPTPPVIGRVRPPPRKGGGRLSSCPVQHGRWLDHSRRPRPPGRAAAPRRASGARHRCSVVRRRGASRACTRTPRNAGRGRPPPRENGVRPRRAELRGARPAVAGRAACVTGSRARSRSRPAAPRHRCPCRTRPGCSSRRRSSAARRRPRGPPPWAGPGCCGTG